MNFQAWLFDQIRKRFGKECIIEERHDLGAGITNYRITRPDDVLTFAVSSYEVVQALNVYTLLTVKLDNLEAQIGAISLHG